MYLLNYVGHLNVHSYNWEHFSNSLSMAPPQTVAERAIKCPEYDLTQSLLGAIIFLHFKQLCNGMSLYLVECMA